MKLLLISLLAAASTVAWSEDILHEFTVSDSQIKNGLVEVNSQTKTLRMHGHLKIISWQYRTFKKVDGVHPDDWTGIKMGSIASTMWGRGMVNQGDEVHIDEHIFKVPFDPTINLSSEVTHVRMMIISIVSADITGEARSESTITRYSKWFPVDQIRSIQQGNAAEPADTRP